MNPNDAEANPNELDARPDQPDARPDQPDARPDQPDPRPDQPAARPVEADASLNGADASPDGGEPGASDSERGQTGPTRSTEGNGGHGEHAHSGPARRGGFWRAAGSVLTVFSVLAGSGAAFVVTSGIVTIVAMAIVVGPFDLASLQDPDAMAQVIRSRIGFPLVVVIPQFALIVLPLAVAALSRSSTRRGLGLVRGHWPLWAWLAAGLAVPLVGMVSGVICGFFFEESDHLRVMTEIFREHGRGGFLIPLALMIGLTPAICEELLFRGFAQTRLTRSLGPVAAIVLASITFAAFHWDPVHAVAVLPIGLFLGLVSWRSGSLFPAMFGHFMNNVTSVAAVTIAPEDASDALAVPGSILLALGVFSAGLIGIGAVFTASLLYGRPDPVVCAENVHAEKSGRYD